MQLASLIAVISYFWTDIKQLTSGVIRAIGDGEYHLTPFRIVVGMLVWTLPIIVAGLLLKKTLNATNSPAPKFSRNRRSLDRHVIATGHCRT